MKNKEAEILLDKYLQGLCSAEEAKIVEDTYDLHILQHAVKSSDKHLAEVRLATWSHIYERTKRVRDLRRWYAAAAFILMALGFSLYLFILRDPDPSQQALGADIQPGTNRASITLSNGQQVDLDANQSSLITYDGRYTYGDGSELLTAVGAEFATVRTPRGGHYVVVLPDTSKVWLNADSYIKYPVQFGPNERRVEIVGEAFLEITKDKQRPFIVESAQQEIQVLGTSFNIDNYGDQGKSVTTLVEGKLRIIDHRTQASTLLDPGQQAILVEGEAIRVDVVDTWLSSSWKDGVYFMKNQPLAKFAKQIERWYDVQFDMDQHETIPLSAIIHRDAKLSEVLDAITAKTGVKFKIEGRRVAAIKK